jgi:two-component system chemotaxis response regulator CheY
MRVLIVDDSVVMRRIVEGALRHSGLDLTEVLQAANGVEALAALEQASAADQPPGLILCDVHMPIMDGLGFLLERSRRGLVHGVPVVMITADATDPYLLRAIAAGAQGYISKPFTLGQMQATVASVLHANDGEYAGRALAAPAPCAGALGGAP